MEFFFWFILFSTFLLGSFQKDFQEWSVVETEGGFQILKGIRKDAIAQAKYWDGINQTGWAELFISTSSEHSDSQQGFAAGILEGYLTQERMYQALDNFAASYHFQDKRLPKRVEDFVQKQTQWMFRQIDLIRPEDEDFYYWKHAQVALSQLLGIHFGYTQSSPPSQQLDFSQIYMLTNMGDLEDLIPALSFYDTITSMRKTSRMDCSGLVKLHPKLSDMYVGHTTFNGYAYMLRVFKNYHFFLQNPKLSSRIMSFSSRPGDLESKDDYYLLDSGLAVIETSLSIFNKTLYSRLEPETVPTWLRSIIANRMASSAKEWCNIFKKYNSGTHNNQWIVVDYNKFKPNQTPLPDTIWLLEQIPGYVESSDITPIFLKQRYFPSYNIPYFKDIFYLTGYFAANFSYENDPRAKMFRHYTDSVIFSQIFALILMDFLCRSVQIFHELQW